MIDVRVGDDGRRRDSSEGDGAEGCERRRFLGVKFECADNQYTRMYKNRTGDAYIGRCPKCLRQIRIGISQGGVDSRFFRYDCGISY